MPHHSRIGRYKRKKNVSRPAVTTMNASNLLRLPRGFANLTGGAFVPKGGVNRVMPHTAAKAEMNREVTPTSIGITILRQTAVALDY